MKKLFNKSTLIKSLILIISNILFILFTYNEYSSLTAQTIIAPIIFIPILLFLPRIKMDLKTRPYLGIIYGIPSILFIFINAYFLDIASNSHLYAEIILVLVISISCMFGTALSQYLKKYNI